MDATAERHDSGREGIAELWFGLLAAPAAWFLHLTVNYSLVRYACATGAPWILHLVTLAALALAGTGGWVAWRNWRRTGRPAETTGGGVEGRSRFMAVGGVAASAFFALVILAAELPNLFLEPCP